MIIISGFHCISTLPCQLPTWNVFTLGQVFSFFCCIAFVVAQMITNDYSWSFIAWDIVSLLAAGLKFFLSLTHHAESNSCFLARSTWETFYRAHTKSRVPLTCAVARHKSISLYSSLKTGPILRTSNRKLVGWFRPSGMLASDGGSAALEQTAVENLTLIGIYVLNTFVALINYSAKVCYTVTCVSIYLFIP